MNLFIQTTLALLLLIPTLAWSMDDTPANRGAQADRYLLAAPPREMLLDMTDQVSLNLAPEQREPFKAMLTKHLDIQAVVTAIREALVKQFTADELSAMADFYSQPVAQSAMKKFGAYMAEIMPTLQAELLKAVAKTNRESGPAEGTPE